MDKAAVAQAAELLSRGRLRREPISPLPEACRPGGEDEAYAVQEALHRRLEADGRGAIAGYKIGCTTEVMQRYLDIGQPCAGGVFAGTVHPGRGRIRAADHQRLGVECEIAVRLAKALTPAGAPYGRESAGDAVAACMAAIEVVEDRYRDFRSLGVFTLIADDFFNAGCALGEPAGDWRRLDLAAARGRMRINGAEVGSGRGGDVMGHPFEALAWLANRYAALGRTLEAGAFVLLGSVVETRWIAAGDVVEVEIDGLGGARVELA